MIRFADPSMWEELQDIWRASFGDGEAYTAFLFEKLLRPEHVLVHTGRRAVGKGRAIEELPHAMLCIEPFVLSGMRESARAAYIYGVATEPDARGQGLSTHLLNWLHGYLGKRGYAASVLVPAGESLFSFYGRRGYETAFSVRDAVVRGGELRPPAQPCVLTPASLYRLEQLRSRLLGAGRELFAQWSRDYLYVISEECRLLGGEVLAVSGAGRDGYAVCYPLEDTVIVKELAVSPARFEDVLSALHARYRAREYRLRLPADYPCSRPGETLPFAMIKWYDKDKQAAFATGRGSAPFITHVLD